METIVDVQTVIRLESSPETVLARIGTNVGGDRAGRTDDDPAAVRRKLEIYHAGTPRFWSITGDRCATVITVQVTAAMTANEVYEALCAAQR